MNQDRRASGPSTADDVVRRKAELMRTDLDYRARVEATEAKRAARKEALSQAEQPILAELRELGIEVGSVWKFHEVPDAIPLAVPLLLDHIQRDYPYVILEGIGEALANKKAMPHWSEIKTVYLSTNSDSIRVQLAGVLAFLARREHYEDLLDFLADERLGESRRLLLRSINRIGNRIGDKQGRAVVESVADDPQLSQVATAILQGRGLSE